MLLEPTARLLPLTVRTAVPIPPDTVTRAVPSCALPLANDTLPVAPALPITAFTVAVRRVVVFGAIFVGVATTVIVVATGAGFTVTVSTPAELAKPAVPDQVAVMELFPTARLVPFTISVAAIAAPEMERFAVPREALPEVKATVPVGRALPEAGSTIAVRTVDAI
jgi:hypothetical protein